MKRIPLLITSAAALLTLTSCGMLKNIVDELNKTPDALPKTIEESRAALADYAASKHGVMFTFTFREGSVEGTGYAGQKDGSYWERYEIEDENGTSVTGYVAIKTGERQYNKYIYNAESDQYVFDREVKGYSAEDLYKDFGGYSGTKWLFFAHTQQLTKKGTSKVLERICLDYEFTYNGIAAQLGEESEYLVSIDNELCITMKIAISGSSSSSRINMDVRAMDTGNSVEIPEVVDLEPESETLESESEVETE